MSRDIYLASNFTVALIIDTEVEHKKVEGTYFFIDRLDKYFFLSDKNEVVFFRFFQKMPKNGHFSESLVQMLAPFNSKLQSDEGDPPRPYHFESI